MEATGANGKVAVDDVFVTISREGSTKLNTFVNRVNLLPVQIWTIRGTDETRVVEPVWELSFNRA